MAKKKIAVVGGGLGGTTAAVLLQRAGYDCTLYEQAPVFGRVGAGINIAPNATRIFRAMGLEKKLLDVGVQPRLKFSRQWDNGEVLFVVDTPELTKLYDAPFLALHRGDLQSVIASALAPDSVRFNKHLEGVQPVGDRVEIAFADGSRDVVDAVVGADGVHSKVRTAVLGPEPPSYHGLVAHRAIFSTSKLKTPNIADNTKWWAPESYFLNYFIREARDEMYFITGVPEVWEGPDFTPRPVGKEGVRRAFEGWHPEVQEMVEAAESITKWPMLERMPLAPWTRESVVLMGDAAHPTTPHMGQGAGMAFEDAVVLVRCIESVGGDDLPRAFRLFEKTRYDRTSRIQRDSHANEWTKKSMDHKWVYGYDAFNVELGVPSIGSGAVPRVA